MKKVIIFNMLALFVASAAFAAGGAAGVAGTLDLSSGSAYLGKTLYGAPNSTVTVGTAGVIMIGKNSTGVGTGWNTDISGYAIWTQHVSGTKSFGTCYDSTSIYQKDATKGSAVDGTTAKTDSSAFSGWNTM